MTGRAARTSLVPQSTGLGTIRKFLEALAKSESALKRLKFTSRRMGYTKNACEALGLIDDTGAITPLGAEYLGTAHESVDEAQVLRRAIELSPILTAIAPAPFSSQMNKDKVAHRLQVLHGFSDTTARDRASNLVSWVTKISRKCPARPVPESEEARTEARSKTTRRKRAHPASRPRQTLGNFGDSRKAKRPLSPAPESGTPNQAHDASKPTEQMNRIPTLKLPRRYETLREESEKAEVDLSNIVQRVDSAAQRIDYLLRKVREGGTGLFEVFFGDSGSGKTTFLQTLPKFFDQVQVIPVDQADGSLDNFVARVEADYRAKGKRPRIYFFTDRDNEPLDNTAAERFFEALRVLFRKEQGRVLVIWPVTRVATRDLLAKKAWTIGADSIASFDSRGVYEFKGIPQEKFFDIADITALSLNGEPLEGYGISRDVGEQMALAAPTISIYFGQLEELASRKRQAVWSILKERILPRLWVVLAGDLGDYLDATISRLTQGRNYRIDIERLLDFLDDGENDSLYFKEWRERRASAAHLFRSLDVRLLPLHPGGAVAAVRGFGSEQIRSKLRRGSMSQKEAIDAIHRTPLYKSILKELKDKPDPYSKGRSPSRDTIDEYKRLQSRAKTGDKGLNHAIAAALRASLDFDDHDVDVRAEKKGLSDTNLQPDVQIPINEAEVICLEITWRTSGEGIKGEVDASQNSMSAGNIQKYLLQKVMEYVRALGL